MKDQIAHLLIQNSSQVFCTTELHVVDYTKQTENKRGLEAFPSQPRDIQSFCLKNSGAICIAFSPFERSKILNDDGKELQHCECVLFPEEYDATTSWILFLELKYREPNAKSSGHLSKAVNQLFSTLTFFRDRHFIDPNKLVYLIISFPENPRVPFESSLFTPSELKAFRKQRNAIVRGVNEVTIFDKERIKV